MFLNYKKIIFVISFNFSLFLLLIIGIQNSSTSKKVNLIINETIELPVSFIVGSSFISGSLASFLFNINFLNKKK